MPVEVRVQRTGQDRRGEGTGAEEGDVPEVEKSYESDDDVQAERGRGEDQHLCRDRHIGVGAVLSEREDEGDEERGENHDLLVVRGALGEPAEDAGPYERQREERCEGEVEQERTRACLLYTSDAAD